MHLEELLLQQLPLPIFALECRGLSTLLAKTYDIEPMRAFGKLDNNAGISKSQDHGPHFLFFLYLVYWRDSFVLVIFLTAFSHGKVFFLELCTESYTRTGTEWLIGEAHWRKVAYECKRKVFCFTSFLVTQPLIMRLMFTSPSLKPEPEAIYYIWSPLLAQVLLHLPARFPMPF
jgi:hypothetical protein